MSPVKVAAGFLVDVRKERPKIWIDPSVQRLGHPFGLIGWLESGPDELFSSMAIVETKHRRGTYRKLSIVNLNISTMVV